MKNLNLAYAEVIDKRQVYYNLNHDGLPDKFDVSYLETYNAKNITGSEDFFRRELVSFISQNSILLSKDNMYLSVSYDPVYNVFRFEVVGEPDIYTGLEVLLDRVDWKMLRDQKFKLLQSIEYMETEVKDNWGDHADALTGILHFIDHIQDTAVDSGWKSSMEVFGTNFNDEEE